MQHAWFYSALMAVLLVANARDATPKDNPLSKAGAILRESKPIPTSGLGVSSIEKEPRTYWIEERSNYDGTWTQWGSEPFLYPFYGHGISVGPHDAEASAKRAMQQAKQKLRELEGRFPDARHVPKEYRVVSKP